MNWYKLAQEDIPTAKQLGMSYYDIGHCNPNFEECINPEHKVTNNKDYLWWYENGELKVKKVDKNGRKTHLDFLGPDILKFFQGRAQITPEKKLVSIAVPDHMVYRSIPEGLIEALQNKFGYDIQLVRFD